MKRLSYIIVIFLVVMGFTVQVSAQAPEKDQQAGQGRGQRFSGQRGMFDPAQIQQMMSDRLKETLEASDDEWKVIGPKVMKVMELSMQARGNSMRMFMRPNMPGMQGQQPPRRRMPQGFQTSAADESIEQLQKLLENKDTPAAEIKNQVIKVRKAREKMDQEKIAAQKELRELLTVRQEATLIAMGLLD